MLMNKTQFSVEGRAEKNRFFLQSAIRYFFQGNTGRCSGGEGGGEKEGEGAKTCGSVNPSSAGWGRYFSKEELGNSATDRSLPADLVGTDS